MTHLVLFGFLLAHVWVYFNAKETNEENFKKWALPLAVFNVVGMIIVNITAFFFLPVVLLMFPLHLFAVILAICNSFICMNCGKWIEKDSDKFSKYKRCTKCKNKETSERF